MFADGFQKKFQLGLGTNVGDERNRLVSPLEDLEANFELRRGVPLDVDDELTVIDRVLGA